MDYTFSTYLYYTLRVKVKQTSSVAWVALLLLTIFAFSLGYFNYINSTIVGILLLSTFIKGQVVIDYFMGLKNVKLIYRLIPTLWLLLIILGIALAYYVPIK